MEQQSQPSGQAVSFEQIEQQLDVITGQFKRLVLSQIVAPLFNGTVHLQQQLQEAQAKVKELEEKMQKTEPVISSDTVAQTAELKVSAKKK